MHKATVMGIYMRIFCNKVENILGKMGCKMSDNLIGMMGGNKLGNSVDSQVVVVEVVEVVMEDMVIWDTLDGSSDTLFWVLEAYS